MTKVAPLAHEFVVDVEDGNEMAPMQGWALPETTTAILQQTFGPGVSREPEKQTSKEDPMSKSLLGKGSRVKTAIPKDKPRGRGEEDLLPISACIFQCIWLLVLLVVIAYCTLEVQWRNQLLGRHDFAGSKGLNLTIENCRVDFLPVKNSDTLTVSYVIGGADSSVAKVQDLGHLDLVFIGSTVGNAVGIKVECSVTIAVGLGFTLERMSIAVSGTTESTLSARSLNVVGPVDITGLNGDGSVAGEKKGKEHKRTWHRDSDGE